MTDEKIDRHYDKMLAVYSAWLDELNDMCEFLNSKEFFGEPINLNFVIFAMQKYKEHRNGK